MNQFHLNLILTKANEPAARLLSKLNEGDAFVLITPEYNRSYSGVLKNALDYLDFQFKQKPIALVSHGVTGGAQAIAHLRGVIPGLLGVTTPRAVFLVGAVADMMDEQGNLKEELKAAPRGPEFALKAMLDETKWYSDALSGARAKS